MSSSVTDAPAVNAGRGPAYAAFWCGMVFTLFNLYWTVGGTFALETVGGKLAQALYDRDQWMVTLVAITVVVKAGGSLFSLALVQQWGRMFPRLLLLVCGWAGTAVLVIYGGLLVGAAAMVEVGIIPAPPTIDWTALRGHLYIWDMWFLVWGILLGWAMLRFSRRS